MRYRSNKRQASVVETKEKSERELQSQTICLVAIGDKSRIASFQKGQRSVSKASPLTCYIDCGSSSHVTQISPHYQPSSTCPHVKLEQVPSLRRAISWRWYLDQQMKPQQINGAWKARYTYKVSSPHSYRLERWPVKTWPVPSTSRGHNFQGPTNFRYWRNKWRLPYTFYIREPQTSETALLHIINKYNQRLGHVHHDSKLSMYYRKAVSGLSISGAS